MQLIPESRSDESHEPAGIGRYVLGALAVVVIVAAFLYADGHFDDGPLILPSAEGTAAPSGANG